MAADALPSFSAFFRKNYAMLGVVFASAFVFEMYATWADLPRRRRG